MSAGKTVNLGRMGHDTDLNAGSGMPIPLICSAQASRAIELTRHDGLSGLRAEWQAFQSRAVGTLYETWEWCCAWSETIGRDEFASPRIVIGRDSHGKIIFILPFTIRRHMGVRVLGWLTAPTLNYGLGLYDPAFLAANGHDLTPHWPQILKVAGPVDAVHLTALPDRWHDRPHPLRRLFTLREANSAYTTQLTTDYETLYAAKRSSSSRRSAKKRDARLWREGDMRFGLPETLEETHTVINAMFAQRAGRMGEMGIGSGVDPREQSFVHRFAELSHGGPVALAAYSLALDGETLAVAMGGIYADTYHALILSMTEGPLRKHSPGDAVLRRTIEACTKAGIKTFDFGAGHSEYKDAWTDEAIPLNEILSATNPLGAPYIAQAVVRTLAKRRIKTSPALWSMARRLRRLTRKQD